ncbi:hypothetical protein AB0J72_25130 [Dactylosporangium sp. NPDC049742]|uniref:hypothetical protein n=1 Tax=Dactylosporangium sp. NPDC049742 TaxID=3154737 RepID=UPI0034210A6B
MSNAAVVEALSRLERLHRRLGEYTCGLPARYHLGDDVVCLPQIRLEPAEGAVRVVMSHLLPFGGAGAFHEIEIGVRLTVTPAGHEGVLFAGIALDPPDDALAGGGTVSHEWAAAGADVLDTLETAAVELCARADPFGFLAGREWSGA